MRPLACFEIGVGFINSGALFSQTEPGKIRHRVILHRVIAAQLIIRPAVGGPQIDTFRASAMFLAAKVDADEASCIRRRSGHRRTRNIGLNCSVPEIDASHKCVDRFIVLRVGTAGWCCQMHHVPSAVGRDFGLPVQYFQTGNGIEWKRGNGRGRLLSQDSDGQECDAARDRPAKSHSHNNQGW